MADVGDEEIVARAISGGERRRHAAELGILLSAFEHGVVDLLVESLGSLHHLLRRKAIDPDVPLTEVERKVRERAEGDAAGHAADTAVTQSVGYEKRECLFLKILRQV